MQGFIQKNFVGGEAENAFGNNIIIVPNWSDPQQLAGRNPAMAIMHV